MLEHLVGTWRLKVFESQAADGNVSFPMGPDALGYLAYTLDGYVFVSISRRETAGSHVKLAGIDTRREGSRCQQLRVVLRPLRATRRPHCAPRRAEFGPQQRRDEPGAIRGNGRRSPHTHR